MKHPVHYVVFIFSPRDVFFMWKFNPYKVLLALQKKLVDLKCVCHEQFLVKLKATKCKN